MKRKLDDVGKKLDCLDDLLRKNMVITRSRSELKFKKRGSNSKSIFCSC